MENVILALPAECWRWYPGYEDIAQVSTMGNVKTVDRWITDKNGVKRFIKGRILKPKREKSGYLSVALCRDGKIRRFLVHRLVAETWIDNPENKPQVNHLDEDKTNNSVENLSFMTAKENNAWGTRTERAAASRINGIRSKAVLALDPKTGQVVKEFQSVNEAGRNGFHSGHISDCCQGKYGCKAHKGLVWRYKDDYDQENAWTPVKIGMEATAASKSKAVQAIDPNTGQVMKEFPSTQEAERNGFNSSNISACCLGKKSHKTYKGYIWRYKE